MQVFFRAVAGGFIRRITLSPTERYYASSRTHPQGVELPTTLDWGRLYNWFLAIIISFYPLYTRLGGPRLFSQQRRYVMSNSSLNKQPMASEKQMQINKDGLLDCHALCKQYQDGSISTQVLKSVSFKMDKGFSCHRGKLRLRKSTLLHLLGGLDSQHQVKSFFFKGQSLNKLSSSEKSGSA